MITISLCMIVKNEENVLGRCLDCISHLVDELIVVDTGSTDRTKEIARCYTDLVYDFEWVDDFAKARNEAFSKATKEYVMWLDADDILTEANQGKFQKLRETFDTRYDMAVFQYETGFDHEGHVTLSYNRERLFRREMNYTWEEPVHEVIVPRGRILEADVAITHRSNHPDQGDRNIRIYENRLKKGEILSPRSMYYYSRELYYHRRYEEAISWFGDFLDSGRGWEEDCIQACKLMAECYTAIGDDERAKSALVRSMTYDAPRASICCELGAYYMRKASYEKAIRWYEAALCERYGSAKGFVYHDYEGYIPALQLCVCYHKVGEREKAIAYNEKAATYKPESEAVKYNRAYFHNTEAHNLSKL